MSDVDKHDPAGMARWLRERSDAAAQFLALTDDQQRQQFLRSWQQNVLPHLAFRFKQAAEMIEAMKDVIATFKQYAEHPAYCAWTRSGREQGVECSCGLHQFLNDLT